MELNPRQKSPERESLPWFAGISVAAADVDRWCLLIQRSNEQGTFSEVELKRLAGLSAELSIVATEARRLGIVRAEGALRIFNMLHLPAALLDRYGRLVEMNQEAKHLFGDDVTICRRQIVSCNHDATMSLDRTLREFIASRGPSTIMPMVTLPRKEDRPLLATGIRLSGISPDVFARCQVVLIFFDLNAHPQPLDNVLRQSFGLSAAETRLAMGLATGKSISVLAEDLNISKQTARHELKSVFAKLSVHRQSELVALLSLLPRSTH
jgi:DNA-binding CsgD family transcriptional regulator